MCGTWLSVCLFALVSALSSSQPNNSYEYVSNVSRGLYFSKDLGIIYRRAGTEECRLCDGDQDCLSLDEARCEIYYESSAILQPEELEDEKDKDLAPEMRAELDSMMYNLVDKASLDPRFKDCIPLISQYTDCTKDNICIGCNLCICDTEGRWNCTMRQQCKPDNPIDVNHRALLVVLDKLRNHHRVTKRCVSNGYHNSKEKPKKVAYEELVEWMYGVKPLHSNHGIATVRPIPQYPLEKLSNLVKRSLESTTEFDGKIDFDDIFQWFNIDQLSNFEASTRSDNKTNNKIVVNSTQDVTASTKLPTKLEADTLAFEEVLHIIADDDQNHNMDDNRKHLDTKKSERISDYMDFEENYNLYKTPNVTEKTTEYGTTQSTVVDMFTESVIDEVTTVVIDLLRTANINNKDINDDILLDYFDIDNKLDIRMNDSNKIELDAVNVMKREIKKNESMETTTLASVNTTQNNVTDTIQDLESSVLRPLNNIINDKQKEIDDLTKIKDNLISFMKTNNFVFTNNETVTENNQPSYLTIYKLEVAQPFLDDSRRSNTSILDNYVLKLKRDIHDVIRDIVGIQKNTDPKTLPNDIKFLIRAMKYYVNKNGFHNLKKNTPKTANFRRTNLESRENINVNPVVNDLILMLEMIDKDMPSSKALQPLSQDTRNVIKRLIKLYFTDEFSVVGLRVYDPHYNLTNDINKIGTRWEKTSNNVANSLPSERIYHLKLLHFVLSTDVIKMKDALALIDFAYSRRMVPIDENIGEEIMSKINIDLKAIDTKIQSYIKKKTINHQKHVMRRKTKNNKKKESFLNQIKKLLRGSKTDIRKLLKKKVPKSVIVKELARKKLDRLTKRRLSEYEQTMRKWQNNLKVPSVGRQKRSSDFKNRMKNIIPKYLRGKVNYTAHHKNRRKTRTTPKPEVTTKLKKKYH